MVIYERILTNKNVKWSIIVIIITLLDQALLPPPPPFVKINVEVNKEHVEDKLKPSKREKLELKVLSFVPLLASLYLSRIHSPEPSSLVGFEAVLLALYATTHPSIKPHNTTLGWTHFTPFRTPAWCQIHQVCLHRRCCAPLLLLQNLPHACLPGPSSTSANPQNNH
ncbi:hypothetical protein JHK85_001423 [Glycine max]|nr:hypothetical protein JHK85_001423 [Glycine max]KAG5088777.1 hypothetical protein JHK86_001389 [Glycine max]